MYTRKLYTWLLCLGAGFCLVPSQSEGATPPVEPASQFINGWRVADADLDGVDDAVDLCPGTPTGTAVNLYGCPLSLATCDYTTATVTLASTGGSIGASVSTRYVLASNTGSILQISTTPSFTGLTGTATYMALALTYDGTVSNLSVGNALSAVSASCLDWSDAVVFKACVAPPPPACDYQVGQTISLQATGGSTGATVKTSYVLTDASGKLVLVSATPSFSTTGLPAGTYQAYSLTYTDDNTITNLVANGTNLIGQVTASCLAKSSALTLTLCGGCVPVCVPLVVSRLR